MSAVQCPVCHSPAALAGNKPYCRRCGWNRELAIAQLRSSLKTFPIGILMFWAFAYFFFFRRVSHFDPIGMIILLVFPGSIMVVAYFLTRRSLNNLLAQSAPTSRPQTAAASTADSISTEETAAPSVAYQALVRSSRPREIRMSSSGKFGILAAVIFALGIAASIGIHLYTRWIPVQSFARFATGDWVLLGIALLLALVPYGTWRGQVNECDLLENGEVVLAKITNQWSGKSGSSVECEFTDYHGQPHKLIAQDTTKKLFEGMSVPVFYDRENPKRNIAYCATLHQIVT